MPCTVEVSHRFESLHAHVRFNNGAVVYPGDEVLVHGAPVLAAYGEVIVEDRTATITRATPLERLWTRMTGDFGFMELCEFSFSEEMLAMNATPMDLYPEATAELAARPAVDTTAMATETTLLNPRFYTTDFDEMDRST